MVEERGECPLEQDLMNWPVEKKHQVSLAPELEPYLALFSLN